MTVSVCMCEWTSYLPRVPRERPRIEWTGQAPPLPPSILHTTKGILGACSVNKFILIKLSLREFPRKWQILGLTDFRAAFILMTHALSLARH